MAHTNWQRHAPQPRPVTLWSVDPSSGHVVSSALAGVTGQVTGYAYNALRDVVLLGTADLAKNDTVRTAYHFWAVRVLSNGQHTSVGVVLDVVVAVTDGCHTGDEIVFDCQCCWSRQLRWLVQTNVARWYTHLSIRFQR